MFLFSRVAPRLVYLASRPVSRHSHRPRHRRHSSYANEYVSLSEGKNSRYSPEVATFNEGEDNEGPQTIESVGVHHFADVVRREDGVNRRVRALPPPTKTRVVARSSVAPTAVARSVTFAAVESGKVERNISGRDGADNSGPKRQELKQKDAETN